MSTPCIRDWFAKRVIEEDHKVRRQLPLPTTPRRSKGPIRVGILGSGAAGLYAAMILESLRSQPGGEDITYEILEANPNRTGGRLYTHYFSQSPNDYYDIGAMRFPEIPFMDRTFNLFRDKLHLDKHIIPYIFADEKKHNLLFFNNIRMSTEQYETAINQRNYDPFGTHVQGLDASVDTLVDNKIGRFKEPFRAQSWEDAWAYLMQADQYTMRSYMTLTAPPYDDMLVTYLETFDAATGLYDCALSEAVMDSLDFDWTPETNWFCVQGGMKVVVDAMIARLPSGAIEKGKRATAIAPSKTDSTDPDHGATSLEVTIAQEPAPRTYEHIISTLPLSCLRTLDTSSLDLSWTMQTAARALHYDSSVKVAIKFKTRWWETLGQIGGITNTDRPTRVVVYPSYGIDGEDATMIVSYTWAQDALRLGTLVNMGVVKESDTGSPPDAAREALDEALGADPSEGITRHKEALLLDIILRDLADIHDIKDQDGKRDYEYLRDLKVAHHAWNWYGDEYAAGAFALFGPGQFKNIYPEVTKPAHGRLHFAGEATSAHHAWVVGALNSAWRSVYEILRAEGKSDLIRWMIQKENWGTVDEYDLDQLDHQIGLGQRHL